MNRKLIAFDIETAKIVPGDDFNWRPHRPLGISCIASLSSDNNEPRIWMTQTPEGTPAKQMSQVDVAAFVQFLAASVDDGFVPLSWNGLAFDFDILAEESGMIDACKNLATKHVDMMFHIVCEKGFPVGLGNAAAGLKLPGKLAGVEGIDAPVLWSEGKHETVIAYVAQDVRTTLDVAQISEKQRTFSWKTKKGTTSSMPLPKGWLSVESALKLPLPDTSWMSNPLKRSDYTSWMFSG